MGYFDNLREKISTAIKPTAGSADKVRLTGYEAYSTGILDINTNKNREYLEEMKGWVGACVDAISDEIATIDLKLYQQGKNGIEEVDDHPLLDVLFRVNEFTTKFDHFWLTQAYLELTGEAPWFLEWEGKNITGIYFLRPDKIRPIVGDNRLVAGYEYEYGPGERVRLELNQVIFLKYPNPSKPFRGKGTLERAARVIDIDNFSEEWNKNFYLNAARPDAILTVDTQNLNDEQRKKLKGDLKEAYEGIKNAHKVMVLFGNMKFEKSSFTMKDMDFSEQQNKTRDKILGVFRVPKAIVAQTEGVNFASAKTAQYVFARWTIKPKMERLIQQLNEFLLPLFPGTENMFLDYTSPVIDDRTEKAAYYEKGLSSGWLTINEVREDEGLPPMEGGDVIYVNPGRMPLGDGSGEEVIQPKTLVMKKGYKKKSPFNPDRIREMRARGRKYFNNQKQRTEIKERIKDILRSEYSIKKGRTLTTKKGSKVDTSVDEEIRRRMTDAEIKEFWTAKNKIFHDFLPNVREKQIEVFQKQRKATLIKLNKKKGIFIKGSDDIFNDIKLDPERQIKLTVSLVLPELERLFKRAADETFDLIDVDLEMDLARDEIKKLLRSSARKFASAVTDVTNDFIRDEVIDSVAKGESIPELADRIRGVFDKAEEFRADRIARTETARYNASATEQAFKDSGIVEGKMWVVNPNACELCLTQAGKTVGLGEIFVAKGTAIGDHILDYEDVATPPLHPNCQCDLVPIFKPAEQRGVNKSKQK